MLRFVILSLALIALINSSNIPKTTATPLGTYQNDKTFVQTACNSTPYPTMCYNALSSYSSIIKSDPIKLCLTSLSVNLESAESASSVVSSLLKKVPNELSDCLKKMKDTADKLKQVITEINVRRLSEKTMQDKLKNRAVPAVLPVVASCMNKINGAKVDAEIKKANKAVSELSMTTTNTLALCQLPTLLN